MAGNLNDHEGDVFGDAVGMELPCDCRIKAHGARFFRVSFAQGSEDDIDAFFGSLCTGCSFLGICYRLVLR